MSLLSGGSYLFGDQWIEISKCRVKIGAAARLRLRWDLILFRDCCRYVIGQLAKMFSEPRKRLTLLLVSCELAYQDAILSVGAKLFQSFA
jgi:hypothetical protein